MSLGGAIVFDLVLSSLWDSRMGLIRLRQYNFLGIPFLLFRQWRCNFQEMCRAQMEMGTGSLLASIAQCLKLLVIIIHSADRGVVGRHLGRIPHWRMGCGEFEEG